MKRRLGLALFFLSSAKVFTGGLPVTDLVNGLQNLAHLKKQLEHVSHVKTRIEMQVKAARRFSSKLRGYRFTNINELMSQIRSFRYRARSIGYAYEGIVRQFEKTYGTKGNFEKKYKTWEKQSDNAIKDAMQTQGLMENSHGLMADLNQAIHSKNLAESDAETLQAIGEVNAVQAKQLNDLKQIIATDARARQSVIMEHRAKDRLQKKYEAKAINELKTPRTSRPLAYFPTLGTSAPKVTR